MANERLSAEAYIQGILKKDRITLARAITLVESQLPDDQKIADAVIDSILPHTGKSVRLGISGSPGVGKSTFIEAFGKFLTDQQKQVAVLTVDPSSQRTKGSILGDKTRMETLSKNNRAFIRPSPAGDTLGGVALRTRESMLLCEAAGYDVIIVETVGVGQSEVSVHSMVDFFLLLMLAGAGDELQGIKKGIVEIADAIAITKADGDNLREATRAQAEYQQAVHFSDAKGISKKVVTCSAITGQGIPEVWRLVDDHIVAGKSSGLFQTRREIQAHAWLRDAFEDLIIRDSRNFFTARNITPQPNPSPRSLAKQLLRQYHASRGQHGT